MTDCHNFIKIFNVISLNWLYLTCNINKLHLTNLFVERRARNSRQMDGYQGPITNVQHTSYVHNGPDIMQHKKKIAGETSL